MDLDKIIAKFLSHPWVGAALFLIMLCLVFLAWRRSAKERRRKSVGDPWLG